MGESKRYERVMGILLTPNSVEDDLKVTNLEYYIVASFFFLLFF